MMADLTLNRAVKANARGDGRCGTGIDPDRRLFASRVQHASARVLGAARHECVRHIAARAGQKAEIQEKDLQRIDSKCRCLRKPTYRSWADGGVSCCT